MAVLYIRNSSGEFEGVQSLNGKTAYQAAKEGGYTGTESEFNAKLAQEIPTALPNPQPITINGQRYDGSEAVTVTVSSEGGGTPVEIDDTLTQSGKAADAKAVGDQLSALNEANAAQNAEIAKRAKDADLAAVAKSGSYNDLTNKPTIPTVPESLKNPNKLTFTGAVTAEYDGSAPVSVEIPAGVSGGSGEWETICAINFADETVLGTQSFEFTGQWDALDIQSENLAGAISSNFMMDVGNEDTSVLLTYSNLCAFSAENTKDYKGWVWWNGNCISTMNVYCTWSGQSDDRFTSPYVNGKYCLTRNPISYVRMNKRNLDDHNVTGGTITIQGRRAS